MDGGGPKKQNGKHDPHKKFASATEANSRPAAFVAVDELDASSSSVTVMTCVTPSIAAFSQSFSHASHMKVALRASLYAAALPAAFRWRSWISRDGSGSPNEIGLAEIVLYIVPARLHLLEGRHS